MRDTEVLKVTDFFARVIGGVTAVAGSGAGAVVERVLLRGMHAGLRRSMETTSGLDLMRRVKVSSERRMTSYGPW